MSQVRIAFPQPAARVCRLALTLLLACLPIAVGCGSLPMAPTRLPPTGASDAPGLAQDPPPAPALRPGDVLRLDVANGDFTQLTGLMIDGQGAIHLPGIGDVRVAGLDLPTADAAVTEVLRRRTPLAVATLGIESSAGQRATLLGAVVRQGPYDVRPAMRLTDLLAEAGGVLTTTAPGTRQVPLADLSRALVVRDTRVLPIDLARAVTGDPGHNVYVHAGDYVFVPPREHTSVTVFGQVGAPSELVHWPGARVTEVMAAAGGINVEGDNEDIRLIRGPLDSPVVFRIDIDAIIDGEAPDVPIREGDILFVTDHWSEDFLEVMSMLGPVAGLTSTLLFYALVLGL